MTAQDQRMVDAVPEPSEPQPRDVDVDVQRGEPGSMPPTPGTTPRGADLERGTLPLDDILAMGAMPTTDPHRQPPAAPPARATRSRAGSANKNKRITPFGSRTAKGRRQKAREDAEREAAAKVPAAPKICPAGQQDDAGRPETATDAPTPSAGQILASSTALGSTLAAPSQAAVVDDWQFIIDVYKDKPVEFAIDILGVIPDEWQARVMRKVAAGKRRISIRAGHGVGKTAFCSWLVIWHMVTRYPQKTVLTAPTAGQLFDALFAEVKFWVRKLPPVILQLFELKSESIELKEDPEGSFVSAKTSSAERPEAMAGVHSEHVLLICDEASAIPEPVYEAASGSMSGFSACTILISNPTRNVGLFYLTHHELADDWEREHVSCVDNPRVNPDFIRQMKATYGEGSNQYRVRVLGEFALHEDDVLISAELVDAAVDRDVAIEPFAPVTYGLDVARFGDDRTVLAKRKGNRVVEIKWWNGYDLMETVGRVLFEAKIDKPAEVCVDVIGYGAGVADALRNQGLNVRDVNVAESSSLNPVTNKLRDELWFALRDWLATRAVGLPKVEGLREELLAPTYGYSPTSGKLKVLDKDGIKKKIRRSPDLADAICLTFAGSAAMVGGRATAWVTGKPLKRNIKGIV